jgi:uncharacterized membrane protein YphA (DoxX/SURF4 family)
MSYGILLLRVVLGLVIAAHGSQKLFGAFGGPGLRGAAAFFEKLRYRSCSRRRRRWPRPGAGSSSRPGC